MAFGPTGTFVRPDLGQYFQSADLAAMRSGFVGLQISQIHPVAVTTASFARLRLRDLLQRRETLRAPGADYARQDGQFIQDNYATNEYGVEEVVDRRERQMYAYTGIQMELIAAERARDVVLREQEIRIAALAFSTSQTDIEGNSVGTAAVSNAWSDINNGTPIADLKTAIDNFWDQAGYGPNVILMNDELMRSLKLSAEVTDRLKFSGFDDPKQIDGRTLQAYFAESGIERVLVGKGRYNSGNEGADVTMTKIWSTDNCLLARVSNSMDLRDPSYMRTFFWTADGAGEGGTIEQYPWEPSRGDVIRCRIDCHEKFLYAKLGYILTNTNAGTA